ncbi:MAG TPA: tetratricopeptide repeat protein, partial [Aggregatilineales bacterium]|nr:tetratricopeptide repeat protein [Aggregatilineales bacterium]
MAGKQDVFENAMRVGDSAAFDEQWERAIEAYMSAVREFPTSTLACNSLGYVLFQAGRLEDAFKVYQQAHKLDPDDPLPVEKSADVLERMGRLNDAAKQYLLAADIYLGQHDLEKAIGNWEQATRLTPGLVKIHQKLAMAYERTGQRTEAINEYLKLAFNFQNAGKPDVAMQALERALRLDSKEPRVLNAITAVRSDKLISPDLLEAPEGATASMPGFGEDSELAEMLRLVDANERGPIGDAVEYALERLAAQVFESGNMDIAEASAMQGIEMHRAGISQEAVGAYQRAEAAGMHTAPLMFNLGALMVDLGQWDSAIKYLKQVDDDRQLKMGASHGLSLSYVGKSQWRNAASSLVGTLQVVDLSLAMNQEE